MDPILMEKRRIELQTILEELIGSKNVYFEPPESVKLKYPCIVYSKVAADSKFADNKLYAYKQRYQVLCIEKNPDSTIMGKVLELPYCSYSRSYSADNLKHDLLYLYY